MSSFSIRLREDQQHVNVSLFDEWDKTDQQGCQSIDLPVVSCYKSRAYDIIILTVMAPFGAYS